MPIKRIPATPAHEAALRDWLNVKWAETKFYAWAITVFQILCWGILACVGDRGFHAPDWTNIGRLFIEPEKWPALLIIFFFPVGWGYIVLAYLHHQNRLRFQRDMTDGPVYYEGLLQPTVAHVDNDSVDSEGYRLLYVQQIYFEHNGRRRTLTIPTQDWIKLESGVLHSCTYFTHSGHVVELYGEPCDWSDITKGGPWRVKTHPHRSA